MPATANGAPPLIPASSLRQPPPAPFAAQPPVYPLPAPTPQNSGPAPYSAQPPQQPGYEQLPPPQAGGAPPFAAPPNWQPPYPPPVPPEPIPQSPARRGPLPLPEMVYTVTSRFWLRPDVLLWDTKAEPVPHPLVTTGSPTDAVPGAIGQPGTQVGFGGGNAGLGYVGGVRIESGGWFDQQRIFGMEAGYFVLIQQNRTWADGSDIAGNPVIARPVVDAQSGAERAYIDSLPGQIEGNVNVILRSEFQGANVDGALNLIQTQQLRLDGLTGFRYLNLAESLNVYDQYQPFAGNTRTFPGFPINPLDYLTDFDGFKVTNSFYGGSGGLRLYYCPGRWYFSALGKVAYGTVQEQAIVSGSTTYIDQNGHTTTLPGGILATTANIGKYYQNPWAVAPEGHFNLAYQIRPSVTVRIGYTFIYVSNVARPGNQINSVTSANLVPS
ncbi:MAG TPA: BBP7 family outer membrane beta-barrel protein, partial [Bryobacteraceae bacterium]|nr:BBP7 family outer membrane beta-barrel protein [Bryobacteraceae bacterium]